MTYYNMQTNNNNHSRNIFLRMHPLHRFGIAVGLSVVSYCFIHEDMQPLMSTILTWDVFSLSYLILSWIVIIKRPVPEIRKLAKKDDGSAIFVFLLILISSFASMFTVLLLMLSQNNTSTKHILYLPIAVGGMMLSWLMVHSIYTFHYAHMYYDDNESGADAAGLEFPGDAQPNYIDFAYFAFVIGCTFQVSDVEISEP